MCGYDSMVNNIYTIVVGGVGDDGKATFYSERCGGVMITSYSEHFVNFQYFSFSLKSAISR